VTDTHTDSVVADAAPAVTPPNPPVDPVAECCAELESVLRRYGCKLVAVMAAEPVGSGPLSKVLLAAEPRVVRVTQ